MAGVLKMLTALRIFEGRFGQLVLSDAAEPLAAQIHAEHLVLVKQDGADGCFSIARRPVPFTRAGLLCVETAIARRCGGRAKIGDLSDELGFSAQSNFTRFFLNQVGIAPSEYRRVNARAEVLPLTRH